MGSFNAACSISSLTIPSGERTLFIPLLPNVYRTDTEHSVGVQHMLIYSNCYFNPFCLPIEGSYDDYGCLDEIKKDANTEAIEKFFGVSIEGFLSCVTSGGSRAWHDYFSGIHETYAVNPELLSDYAISFDKSFLKKLGFIEGEVVGEFTFQEFPYRVIVNKPKTKPLRDDLGFRIIDKHGVTVFETGAQEHESKETLHEQFHKLTGWYLGILPKHQKCIDLLRKMSGTFIIKDIYDAMSRGESTSYWKNNNTLVATGRVTVAVLTELGFKKTGTSSHPTIPQKNRKVELYEKKGFKAQVAFEEYGSTVLYGKKKITVYTVKDLGPAWGKATKEKLELSKYDTMYQMDIRYDEFRKTLRDSNAVSTEIGELNRDELYEQLGKEDAHGELWHYLSRFTAWEKFGGYFKEWKYVDILYRQAVIDGKLKEDFRWYASFYHSMYSTNRFFFPSMGGEQEGNDAESKVLLEASLKIVNRRLKKSDEDNAADIAADAAYDAAN